MGSAWFDFYTDGCCLLVGSKAPKSTQERFLLTGATKRRLSANKCNPERFWCVFELILAGCVVPLSGLWVVWW
jgi:hypothetical protein